MFEEITYKTKNQLLLVVIFLLAIVIYLFAIKKTIGVYQQYTEAKNKMELVTGVPLMINQLEKELKRMDANIGNQNTSGANSDQALLDMLTTYCQTNHAVLREFPQATSSMQGNLVVETNAFVVEGNFTTLLQLVYAMEQKYKVGKLASVRYQLKKDIKTSTMVLTAKIYVQNIKKKQNEK